MNRAKGGAPKNAVSEPTDPIELARYWMGDVKRSETHEIKEPRASGIYSACMRKHVIGTKEGLTEVRYYSASDVMTMDVIGTLTHETMQNDFIFFGTRRIGWWRCSKCGFMHSFGAPPSKACTSCEAVSSFMKYEEHELKIPGDCPVSGHPDLFMATGHGTFVVFELKTIKGKGTPQWPGFDDIVMPMISHQWQLQTYLWALNQPAAKLPIKVEPYGYVLYVSKAHERGFPFKCFRVNWDEDLMGRIKAKLGLYKRGVDEYKTWLPEVESACVNSNWASGPARGCAASPICKERYLAEKVKEQVSA